MKQLKKDVKSGMNKWEAFESFKQRGGENLKKASTYLSYRPEPQLLKKYSIANYVLMFLFILKALGCILEFVLAFNTSLVWVLMPVFLIELGLYISIILFLFRGIASAYFTVVIVTINPLINSIWAFLNGPNISNAITVGIFTSVIVLAIDIKLKLFPFQNLLHTKKDDNGIRTFSSVEQVENTSAVIDAETVQILKIQENEKNEKNKKSKQLIIKLSLVLVALSIFFAYLNFIQTASDVKMDLKTMWDKDQSKVIQEYKDQGLKLKCFSNLKPEEKISPKDDYLCWTEARNVLGIPSKNMAIFFSEKKLSNVRLEFPKSSFDAVQGHLLATLNKQPRLDYSPGINNTIMSWKVDHGIVNSNKYKDDMILITWSSVNMLSHKGREEFENIQ